MNKLKKRVLSLGLALVMTLTMIPMFGSLAFADDATSIQVYLTVSNKGELAKANDGTVMAQKPVTVTDLDANGKYSYDEALVAAHKAYNSEDGYSGGPYVEKLWGVSSTNCLFFINGSGLSIGVSGNYVEEGDYLTASINKDDKYYSDFYSYFSKDTAEIYAGQSVTLSLSAFSVMAGGDPIAVKGASVGYYSEDGSFVDADASTDDSGNVTVSFDTPGTYYVTASGVIADQPASDYNMMNEAHMADGFPDMYMVDGNKFVAFTDTEGGMSYMYTLVDYDRGPYPEDEIVYIDILDYFELEDEDLEGLYFLCSNQVLTDSPIITPVCAVTVLPTIEVVRAQIQALSVDPTDYTADDADRIEAIWEAFQALSAEDQAVLDAECSHADTGQPLGRVLETALWAVWSYGEIDNSTTLPDGTYNASTIPALSSAYSKGKSTSGRQKPWSVKDVTVSNGKATATIMVESTSYTAIWMGGETYPKTNTSGNCEFANVPIDLNSTFYFAGVSSSMPQPIAFSLTSTIDEFIPLDITNQTNMFKAVSASLQVHEGQLCLVAALSGTGYHELFKGTYDEAVANGDNTDNWILGYLNDDGKWEFIIPLEEDESYMPIVAISDSYYKKYLDGQNPLARAFYPRQFTVDMEALTLVTGDYSSTSPLTIDNHISMFSLDSASLTTVGGPNSNGYKISGTVKMGSASLTKVYVGPVDEANEAAEEDIQLLTEENGYTWTIDLEHIVTAGDPETIVSVLEKPIYVSFYSKKNSSWYERILTFSKVDMTLTADTSAADYTEVDAAKANAAEVDVSLYTTGSYDALTEAVDAVETGKFASQQAAVDAMAQAINTAIDNLNLLKLEYTGDAVSFVKSDLTSKFGMLTPQDGTTVKLDGDNIVIHVVPKNTTIYNWLHWGGHNDAVLTKDIQFNSNGTFDIIVSKDQGGYAYAIAPIKKDDDTASTSAQYYITIPTADKIAANEVAAAAVEEMISELPVVEKLTLADKDKVQEVLDAYNALSDGEKAAVDNYQELKLAETAIKLLYAQEKIAELQEQLARKNERIYGSSRYETSRKVADRFLEESGADKFANIVVACGTNFPDALGAGYLAKVKDAPILLVGADSEAEIANYIKENLAEGGNVYLIGGTGAVSAAFETSISGNANVKRLFGQNRYDTNIEVLKEAGVSNENILVCTGTGFADSLSATSVGLPILLVGDSLTDEQKAYLGELESEKFYLIGGTGVVKDSIATEIKGVKEGATVNRIAGANRYATSSEVAKTFFSMANRAVLAYAQNFPDGLSAGALAMKIGAPVILADSANTSEAAAYVKAAGVKGVITIGGPALISDQAVNTITGR